MSDNNYCFYWQHKFSKWSAPEKVVVGVSIEGKYVRYRQARVCSRCGEVQHKFVEEK